jgi:uncharacterized protein (TIGR03067 family)
VNVVLLFGIAFGLGAPAPKNLLKPKDQIEGVVWFAIPKEGEPMNDKWKEMVLKDGYYFHEEKPVDDPKPDQRRYKIDKAKKPMEIDLFEGMATEPSYTGIFRIEKGELWICWGHGQSRPTDFMDRDQQGKTYYWYKYRREK